MKRLVAYFVLISVLGAPLWAMPSQITFQGTLKQTGTPVNTTKNMQFSFVDGTGATIPGTQPVSISNVSVTNGLFAVQLPIDPTIPWEQYTPYVRVSVEGQILSPDQPLNANLYAVAAIPQGMVAMFATTCPVGWTRFSALDNAFPMGGPTYGATGGSATHSHKLAKSRTASGAQGAGSVVASQGDGADLITVTAGGGANIDIMSNLTTSGNNLPPYLTVVYCQKT